MSPKAAPTDREAIAISAGSFLDVLPGLLLSAALGAAAIALADLAWFRDTLHWSALLIVILLGMALGSLIRIPDRLRPGIALAQRPILRWAVAGLGFRLSLPELWAIGAPALGVVVISTVAALAFGWWIARRLGVGEDLGTLLGVGGAICGASAVVAADSVVQAEKRDAALALGIVTLLGTIGIVVYPLLHQALGMSDFLYGVWDGASLHEMAQVVAAGFGVSDSAGHVATVVKLARISLLAPVVLYLGWSLHRRRAAQGHARGTAKVAPVPWFLVLFVAFTLLHSTGWISRPTIELIRRVDLWLLCVGMAGVGLGTSFGDLRNAGLRPLAAGALQWIFLAAVSYLLAVRFCR